LRSMVHADPSLGWRERYGAERTVEVLPEDVERFEADAAVNVLVPDTDPSA
ncbi:MAG: NADH-quinone oxidoreductase subunit, partial [Baekduia sp.]|nr:NADH-quinone oxidoreductase subunit [Baekduia sp.]